MISAEDIVELEKKWLRYKIKSNFKFYALFIIFVSLITFTIFYMFLKNNNATNTDNLSELNKTKKIRIVKNSNLKNKSEIEENRQNTLDTDIGKGDSNKTIFLERKNSFINNNEQFVKNSNSTEKDKIEPKSKKEELFSFKIEPTPPTSKEPLNSKELVLHRPYDSKMLIKNNIVDKQNKIKNKNLVIQSSNIDTLEYLKNKFYQTSNISFALMIAQEYYYKQEYQKSLKWALIANDLNFLNEDSWYWFAKSKVKLNEKEDAIKALKAYLEQNKSAKLKVLLTKIQHGDSNGL